MEEMKPSPKNLDVKYTIWQRMYGAMFRKNKHIELKHTLRYAGSAALLICLVQAVVILATFTYIAAPRSPISVVSSILNILVAAFAIALFNKFMVFVIWTLSFIGMAIGLAASVTDGVNGAIVYGLKNCVYSSHLYLLDNYEYSSATVEDESTSLNAAYCLTKYWDTSVQQCYCSDDQNGCYFYAGVPDNDCTLLFNDYFTRLSYSSVLNVVGMILMALLFILTTISLFFGPKKKAMGDHQIRKEEKRRKEEEKKQQELEKKAFSNKKANSELIQKEKNALKSVEISILEKGRVDSTILDESTKDFSNGVKKVDEVELSASNPMFESNTNPMFESNTNPMFESNTNPMFESNTNPMLNTHKESSDNNSHSHIEVANKKPNPLLKQKTAGGGAAGWAKLKQMHKQGQLVTEESSLDSNGAIKPLSPPSHMSEIVSPVMLQNVFSNKQQQHSINSDTKSISPLPPPPPPPVANKNNNETEENRMKIQSEQEAIRLQFEAAEEMRQKKEKEEEARILAEYERARIQAELDLTNGSYNAVAEETSTYVLPEGWYSDWDETNQAYYYVNEATGESQWDAPVV